MRFVPVKTTDQQSVLVLHRTRQLFIRQRTTLINSIRANLAEFGIVAGIGRHGVEALLEVIAKGEEQGVPRRHGLVLRPWRSSSIWWSGRSWRWILGCCLASRRQLGPQP